MSASLSFYIAKAKSESKYGFLFGSLEHSPAYLY